MNYFSAQKSHLFKWSDFTSKVVPSNPKIDLELTTKSKIKIIKQKDFRLPVSKSLKYKVSATMSHYNDSIDQQNFNNSALRQEVIDMVANLDLSSTEAAILLNRLQDPYSQTPLQLDKQAWGEKNAPKIIDYTYIIVKHLKKFSTINMHNSTSAAYSVIEKYLTSIAQNGYVDGSVIKMRGTGIMSTTYAVTIIPKGHVEDESLGTNYTGQLKNGQADGLGTEKDQYGIYSGGFSEGKRNGLGQITNLGGQVTAVHYDMGKLVSG